MYSCKLTVITTNVSTGDSESKDFNGVNPKYLASIGVPYSVSPTPEGSAITGKMLPQGYNTFWAWADAVGRGIASLSTNTYYNSRVQAIFDVNQEVDS